jgi:MoxR-like ATPase
MSGDSPQVIDRDQEAELLEAALRSGAHVVLEGPPGTGKSTLLRQVASGHKVPFVLVEGNAELTPARLVGHFDPALVLARGYRPDIFVDGPLLRRCAPAACCTSRSSTGCRRRPSTCCSR